MSFFKGLFEFGVGVLAVVAKADGMARKHLERKKFFNQYNNEYLYHYMESADEYDKGIIEEILEERGRIK